jgi:hypothetical protein
VSGSALADGDSISQWSDVSGNAKHGLQATGSLRPTLKLAIQNGKPVIRFDGTDDKLVTASITWGSVVTVFCVGVGSGGFAGINANLQGQMRSTLFGLQVGQTVGSWTMPVWGMLVGQHKSTDSKAWKDGVQSGATNANALSSINAGAVTVGERGAGDLFLNGDIGELIIWNAELSTGERIAVENYLRQRWGTP